LTGKIFISYRRGDDPGHTGRLFDRLQTVFEPQQLFLDVDDIALGLDFVETLNQRVSECDVLLAIIGKGWIDARDKKGHRRLDDPEDFVRIEIASALSQNKRVIPVLVGDATMPAPNELPETIRAIARRNAIRLTHERFHADTQGLIKALQQVLKQIKKSKNSNAMHPGFDRPGQRAPHARSPWLLRAGWLSVSGGLVIAVGMWLLIAPPTTIHVEPDKTTSTERLNGSQSENRVALVVGNSAYFFAPRLLSP
jgi:hypothetical protein